jgi:CBS domain-containing protein
MSATSLSAGRPPARVLASRPVEGVMHRRLITCPPETPLRAVARMLSTYRIHALVVDGEHEGSDRPPPWVIVSDRDVVDALAMGEIDRATAGSAAATEFLTARPDESLEDAARLLHEHDVAHLVVIDPRTKRPLGILSTLDIAAAIASLA